MNPDNERDFLAADARPDTDRPVMTVRQVNESVSAAIARAFPGTVWVRGEVQRLPADAARRTHIYFELHETGGSGAAEYQISTSLMGWDRQRFGLGRYLDGTDPDFQLANKMEVCLECKVDFYAKFGKMSLKVVGVDKNFALGRLEARRRETLAYLKAHDLLERNAALVLNELPLRIGLITSAGSAAERDFMTGIEASPWAFQVSLRGAKMQGEQLQAEVIAALKAQLRAAPDVIVITRGGGSRADLSWFDQQDLAVAIAECPVPVVTAIGHEIDTSIADLVAHHACKTPTAAAEFLVERVDRAAGRLAEASDRLLDLVEEILVEAREQTEVSDRLQNAVERRILQARMVCQKLGSGLQTMVTGRLESGRGGLADMRVRLGTVVSRRLGDRSAVLGRLQDKLVMRSGTLVVDRRRHLDTLAKRLEREGVRPLGRTAVKLDNMAAQTRLLDPLRLLARGYTITTGPDASAVHSVLDLAVGDRVVTRFADGQVASIVQPGKGVAKMKSGKEKPRGGKNDQSQKNPGQKTLFR